MLELVRKDWLTTYKQQKMNKQLNRESNLMTFQEFCFDLITAILFESEYWKHRWVNVPTYYYNNINVKKTFVSQWYLHK